jgi:Ca2+-transporting ATPase
MTKENLLVRVLGSCETMANASVVCTDKTGTLTMNEMAVVAGAVGVHGKFVRRLEEHAMRTNANDAKGDDRRHNQDFSLDQAELNNLLPASLRDIFNEAITCNSTAFEDVDQKTGKKAFVGSKTETALLAFAQELGWADWKKTRESKEILQMVPFSSERKAMGVVIRHGTGARLYIKGASEILTAKCTSHVVVRQGNAENTDDVEVAQIGELEAENMSRTIIFYANQTLRTIALCYKDFESWPPRGATMDGKDVSSPTVFVGYVTDVTDTGRVRVPLWRSHSHWCCWYRRPSPSFRPAGRCQLPSCWCCCQDVHW